MRAAYLPGTVKKHKEVRTLGWSSAESGVATVLIVDESEECREVLRTALEIRGVDTLEAAEPSQGLALLAEHHPQLVVLDSDSDSPNDTTLRSEYDRQTRAQETQLLVLGRAKCAVGALRGEQVIPKPYHFGPLLRTIEQLLQR